MFRSSIGKSRENTLPRHRQTKFDATSRLDGKIFGSEKIMIEGQFKGEIIVDDFIEISQNAKVKGSIKADNLSIFGKMDGNIEIAGGLSIGKTALILGDIKAGTLEIAAGAVINGQCSIGEAQNSGATIDSLDVSPAACPRP